MARVGSGAGLSRFAGLRFLALWHIARLRQSEAASEMPYRTGDRNVGRKKQPVEVYGLGKTDKQEQLVRNADLVDLERR